MEGMAGAVSWSRGQTYLRYLKELVVRRYPWQIHFFNETLTRKEISSVLGFLMSGEPLQEGEYLNRYEHSLKQVLGGRGHVFGFGSGRMALYAILDALGIGRGDQVVLPAFTCEVVVHALLYRGIVPVYADIDPYTFAILPSAVQRVITPKTRAIIAQHNFGVPCDVDALLALADNRNIAVIEDCALALGSTYRGRPVGTIGDAAIFSTDRSKLISTQWGGSAFTVNEALAAKLRQSYSGVPHLTKARILNVAAQLLLAPLLLSPFVYYAGKHVISVGLRTGIFFSHKDDKERFTLPDGYPCRFSNLQAFVGLGQLSRLQDIIEYRKSSVQEYLSILRDNGILLDEGRRKVDDVTLRFSLLLRDREAFVRKWGRYFEVGRWFDSPAIGWYGDLHRIGYGAGSCPVADFVHGHVVNFPTHQTSLRMKRFLHQIVGSIRKEDLVPDEDLSSMAERAEGCATQRHPMAL
jgi:perosamine synthetase